MATLIMNNCEKSERQRMFAVQQFIIETIEGGNNEFKLKKDAASVEKVLNDEDTFPYYMKLGTGIQTKEIWK